MHLRRKLFGTRRRIVATGIVLALVLASAAAAAWFIVTLTGSGGGSFGTASPITLTATPNTSSTPCLPGATCDISFSENNTSGSPLTITTLTLGTATAVGAPGGCTIPAGSFTLNAGQVPFSVPTRSNIYHLNIAASSGLPACLSGATFTITLSGNGSS